MSGPGSFSPESPRPFCIPLPFVLAVYDLSGIGPFSRMMRSSSRMRPSRIISLMLSPTESAAI
jgi:hypothetical protein